MAKGKNAKELSEIIASQLDILTSGKASIDDVHMANAVTAAIGKELKLASLRMMYADYKKTCEDRIESLESGK